MTSRMGRLSRVGVVGMGSFDEVTAATGARVVYGW